MKNEWIVTNPSYESDKINPDLAVSPWEGHRNFVYDFINFIEPKKIVELGTHYGCSFFAMCQSVKENNLDTKIYAIDTWQGDEQAGFYSDDVFNIVNKTIDQYFDNIKIDLKRMTFDQALSDFEDESIDILHIDGLHTYEAVTHDFNTWLPKLKKDGIILFHDIASYLEYGTNKFWDELKCDCKFVNYQMNHSWGLGILMRKESKYDKILANQNFNDKLKIYEYKARFELENIKNRDLTQMVEERDAAIKSNEQMIEDRDNTIKSNEQMIKDRDNTIKSNEQMIEDRDSTIKSNEQMIKDRDNTIKSNEQMIEDRDKVIKNYEDTINIKDKLIYEYEKDIEELKQELDSLYSKKIILNLKKGK